MSLMSEIEEQPVVVDRLVASGRADLEEAARVIRETNPNYILIAARGTSDNAARYAKYLFGIHNRTPVALADPSLFSLYTTPPRLDGALVLAISQSGYSPDIVSVVEESQRQGRPSIVLTNDKASPLSEAAVCVVDLGAGPEVSVAATKTYTAELVVLAALSSAVGGADHDDLSCLADSVRAVLASRDDIERTVEAFASANRSVVLGRGYHLATAFEWALKIEELCRQVAHPYSVADFLHGPIAVVEEEFPVLAIATGGVAFNSVAQVMFELEEQRRPNSLVITDRPDCPGRQTIRIPRVPEWLSPIPAIVASQVFARALAVAKGFDPEQPRGLAKVTKTT